MKKLIGVLALVITANISMVGFQSYSNRDEHTQLAALQERLQVAESKAVERDAAIKELHGVAAEWQDGERGGGIGGAGPLARQSHKNAASNRVDTAVMSTARRY